MEPLTKEQAEKIAEMTSTVFPQGNSWVMQEMDLETGVYRLTRGLSEKVAKQKLKSWRRERIEQLLRATPNARVYTLRAWYENPHWNGQGFWRWAHSHWYTSREAAEQALEKLNKKSNSKYEIFESKMEEIPGHFVVA